MTIDGNDLLNSILASLDRVEYININDVPNIDLYMDQVTTFMDKKLRSTLRDPSADKVLTKTMINNYAKNDLLPPPVKKKYSKEHLLLLIFIYYYKGVLSIMDIQTLLDPLANKYFKDDAAINLEDIYKEAYSLGKEQLDELKADVIAKYSLAQGTFKDAPEEDREFLRKFSFICSLSFDVYIKKLIIEKLIDDLAQEKAKTAGGAGKNEGKKSKKKSDSVE